MRRNEMRKFVSMGAVGEIVHQGGDLRVAEVSKLDLVIIDGKVTAFRTRLNLSFKYEGKD